MGRRRKSGDPPEQSAGDVAHAAGRSVLSAIPIAGGAAVELFTQLVTPPLERRRQEWMRDIGERLQRLEEQGLINIDDLREDESFLDTVLHASQIAMRTRHVEKRHALLNAITNSVLPNAPEDALQHMYLDLVDTLTEWHLRILKLFQDPPGWAQALGRPLPEWRMGGLGTVLEHAYPELAGRRDFYDQVWRDLYLRGLVTTEELHATLSGPGMVASRTSPLGNGFLHFLEQSVE